MKMVKYLLVSIGLALIVVNTSAFDTKLEGSGNVIKETRELSSFHSIDYRGSIDIELKQGEEQKVEVEVDDNILPYVKTEVNEMTLKIWIDESCSNLHGNRVYIQIPKIQAIKSTGSGDVNGKGLISGDDMTLSIKGSGDFNLELIVDTINASIKGSGDMKLNGEVENFNAGIKGSGDIKAQNLIADTANINILGSGDCKIHASKKLNISIKGSGDVSYWGDPEVKQSVLGSGDVNPMK